MRTFRDQPIRTKILATVVIASGLAALISGFAFLVANIQSSGRQLETSLQNKAALLAVFSEASLDFDDAETGQQALRRISREQNITAAGILRNDGSLLAHHPQLSDTRDFQAPASTSMVLVQRAPVFNANREIIGEVYLAMDISEERRWLFRSALSLTGAVIVFAFFVSVMVSVPLQRIITRPIIELRQVAQVVSTEPERRAPKRSEDEVGELVDEFNLMLDTLAQREQAIRDRENEYHGLVDNLNIGICRLAGDDMGTMLQANPAAATMLGFAGQADILGIGIETFFTHPREWQVLRRVVPEMGQVKNYEVALTRRDGAELWCAFSARERAQPITGRPPLLDTVLEDITDRKHAEQALAAHQEHLEGLVAARTLELEQRNAALRRSSEQLRQFNEELKNFTYIVSHDLRAPLVNLKGFAAELNFSIDELKTLLHDFCKEMTEEHRAKAESLIDKDMQESLTYINASATRMDSLLNSILKLSRLGRREMTVEALDPNEIVADILDNLRHQMEARQVEVTVGELPKLMGDRTSLDQIFGNLIENAVKFLDDGRPGRIAILGKTEGGMVKFSIEDNGRGIAEKDLDKIFDIFRRAGRQDRPGEGMGLAYVRALVRRLGGEIECDSVEGEGTVFRFTVCRNGPQTVEEDV